MTEYLADLGTQVSVQGFQHIYKNLVDYVEVEK